MSTKKKNKKDIKKKNKEHIINHYYIVIFLMMVIPLGVIWQLSETTIIHRSEWLVKSQAATKTHSVKTPLRGQILSDDGSVLATTLMYYDARMDFRSEAFDYASFNALLPKLCDSLEVFDADKGGRNAKEWATILKDQVNPKPRTEVLLYDSVGAREINALRGFSCVSINSKTNKAFINYQSSFFNGNNVKRVERLAASLAFADKNLKADDDRKDANQWVETIRRGLSPKKLRNFRLFQTLSNDEILRLRKFPFLSLRAAKSGFYAEPKEARRKPYGQMAWKSIGDVTSRYVKDHANGHDEVHGSSGIEMALDSLLYGKNGTTKRIHSKSGLISWADTVPVPGYNVTTTINIVMQDIVEDELNKMCIEKEAQWGTAVLMEVATGEIKAISSLERNPETGEYEESSKSHNHAFLGYEPGSVIKPISMMAALNGGAVTDIEEMIPTGRAFVAYGRRLEDKHGAADALRPRDIIARSSNVGITKIVYRLCKHPDDLRQRLSEMGFFDAFNTGIAGERRPVYPKLGNKSRDFVTLSQEAFGYSTQIPPIYTLAMYNAIANDGKFVRPRIVKKLSREGEPDSIIPVSYIREQVTSPENAAKLRIMLHDVVWDDHGTAKALRDDRVNLSGKTGTALVIDGGRYVQGKFRLAFCGFYPYDKPKYSCIVLMSDAGRSAPLASGMVFKNIALRLYAKGFLDSNPSYKATAESKPAEDRPTLLASDNNEKRSQLASITCPIGSNPKMIKHDSSRKEGVPSVVGFGLREAVSKLEKAGLYVEKVNGTGRVVAQSIPPGSKYRRGTPITLTLQSK